ncbi:MAG: metal-dependent hydrolase [Xanthomonadales bacterium]|nr:metal-dependent hydrolase [Xanthomonadales bacterium]
MAAVVLGAAHMVEQAREGQFTTAPLATAFGGFLLGTLPDLLEPATTPSHRATLHSVGALAVLGLAGWKLYQWEPEDATDQIIRWIGLVTAGAYAVHLFMDSQTPRGLPIL